MVKSKTHSLSLLLLGVMMIFVSCDRQLVFEEHKNFPNQYWHKDSTATFVFKADTIFAPAITFSFNIRQNTSYIYSNMWLFMDITLPTNKHIIDTINVEFMDQQGKWKENVKGGTIKEIRYYYKFALANPPSGIYDIKLRHGMREEQLQDVVSVGARIEKLNND